MSLSSSITLESIGSLSLCLCLLQGPIPVSPPQMEQLGCGGRASPRRCCSASSGSRAAAGRAAAGDAEKQSMTLCKSI